MKKNSSPFGNEQRKEFEEESHKFFGDRTNQISTRIKEITKNLYRDNEKQISHEHVDMKRDTKPINFKPRPATRNFYQDTNAQNHPHSSQHYKTQTNIAPSSPELSQSLQGSNTSFTRSINSQKIRPSITSTSTDENNSPTKQTPKPGSNAKISDDELATTLLEKAESQMICHEYEKALNNLEPVIDIDKGTKKLHALIDKCICQTKLNQKEDAVKTCAEIDSFMNDECVRSEISSINIDKFFFKLIEVCKNFSKLDELDSALNSLIRFTEQFYQGQESKIKYVSISELMEKKSTEECLQNKKKQIVKFYPLFEKIYKDMISIDDNDKIFNCKQIVYFFKCFAAYCLSANDYQKAKTVSEKVTTLIDSTFGDNVDDFDFGVYYYNFGYSCKKLSHFEEARDHFQKALSVFNKASDFLHKNRKENYIKLVVNELQEVEEQLKK